MPYLGNTPAVNFASVTKDTFSGNGSTTAFTLSKPATTNGVAVYVENVRQIPTTAYAISGTTLTFTGAPPSGTNNIYVMHHNTPVSTATHPAAQNLTAVDGTFTGDVSVGDDLSLASDSAAIKFGADSEITLTHDADQGLTIKHASSADNKFPLLTLAAGDNDISANDVLGQIRWIAPDEGTGTDAVTMAGNIQVVSEGDFAADNNAVYMSFATGLSGAATDKLFLNSAGNVGIGVVSPTSPLGANFKVLDINSGVWGGNINFSGNSGGYIGNRHSGNGGLGYYAVSGQGHDFAVNGSTNSVLSLDHDGFLDHFADHNGDLTARFNATTTGTPYGVEVKFTQTSPDNTTSWAYNFTDSTVSRFRVYSDGDVVNHDNSYGASSDERIKQDIVDANSQWDDIKAIKVRNYKKKDDVAQYGEKAWTQIGVVAQEIEKVSPKLIKEHLPDANDIKINAEFGTLYEDGDTIPEGKQIGDVKEIKDNVKRVSYSVLYMKAVKALQEAMARIETLEAKVKALEEA